MEVAGGTTGAEGQCGELGTLEDGALLQQHN